VQHSPGATRNLLISNMLAPPKGQGAGHFGKNLRDITLLGQSRAEQRNELPIWTALRDGGGLQSPPC
jgi:hypothetical protein